MNHITGLPIGGASNGVSQTQIDDLKRRLQDLENWKNVTSLVTDKLTYSETPTPHITSSVGLDVHGTLRVWDDEGVIPEVGMTADVTAEYATFIDDFPIAAHLPWNAFSKKEANEGNPCWVTADIFPSDLNPNGRLRPTNIVSFSTGTHVKEGCILAIQQLQTPKPINGCMLVTTRGVFPSMRRPETFEIVGCDDNPLRLDSSWWSLGQFVNGHDDMTILFHKSYTYRSYGIFIKTLSTETLDNGVTGLLRLQFLTPTSEVLNSQSVANKDYVTGLVDPLQQQQLSLQSDVQTLQQQQASLQSGVQTLSARTQNMHVDANGDTVFIGNVLVQAGTVTDGLPLPYEKDNFLPYPALASPLTVVDNNYVYNTTYTVRSSTTSTRVDQAFDRFTTTAWQSALSGYNPGDGTANGTSQLPVNSTTVAGDWVSLEFQNPAPYPRINGVQIRIDGNARNQAPVQFIVYGVDRTQPTSGSTHQTVLSRNNENWKTGLTERYFPFTNTVSYKEYILLVRRIDVNSTYTRIAEVLFRNADYVSATKDFMSLTTTELHDEAQHPEGQAALVLPVIRKKEENEDKARQDPTPSQSDPTQPSKKRQRTAKTKKAIT